MLLLAPDVGILGYLANPRVGAVAYTVFHTALLSSVVVGVVTGSEATSAVGIVWCAPIGLDRALGYGLKYAAHVKHTPRRSRIVRQAVRPCEVQGVEWLGDREGGSRRERRGAPSEAALRGDPLERA
jgi:Domain of unknown function (DUF4260)